MNFCITALSASPWCDVINGKKLVLQRILYDPQSTSEKTSLLSIKSGIFYRMVLRVVCVNQRGCFGKTNKKN